MPNKLRSLQIFGWLLDVRLWIFALFLIRLETINLPPLDEHNLRQTLTLTAARNMIEISPNPLKPMLSAGRGSCPDPVAMEPGIYTGLIAVSYKIFGEHYWNSRLINLIVSSAGLWFFYAFLTRFWPRPAALASTILFGVSITFIYARKSMPDTFALSFVLMGNYYGAKYLNKSRWSDLSGFVLTMSTGLLVKLPMACAAMLLLWPFVQSGSSRAARLRLVVAACVPLSLMALWYFWWTPKLIHDGALRMYETYGFVEGWRQFWALREGVWDNFTRVQMGSYWPFALLLPGIYALGRRHQERATLAIFGSAAVFAVFIIQAAYAYPTHEYYGIPFNPAYAMIAGFGLSYLFEKWPVLLFSCLLAISIVSIRHQKNDFFVRPEARKFLQLGPMADSVSLQSDKFLVNDAVYTRMLYFLHRQGRSEGSDLFKKYPEWVYDYGREGIKFICTDRAGLPDSLNYPIVAETPDFRIYRHTWSPVNPLTTPR
ncbi:MAG: glycosyltransferase family 39 protein [Saprospiraceae bacterium]